MYFLLKTLLSAVIVAAVSEISKRSTWIGALVVSLPLTSILAMIWLYQDTGETRQVVELSNSIFWMVLPSLFFFFAFPLSVKMGLRFYPALLLSCAAMAAVYAAYSQLLKYWT